MNKPQISISKDREVLLEAIQEYFGSKLQSVSLLNASTNNPKLLVLADPLERPKRVLYQNFNRVRSYLQNNLTDDCLKKSLKNVEIVSHYDIELDDPLIWELYMEGEIFYDQFNILFNRIKRFSTLVGENVYLV